MDDRQNTIELLRRGYDEPTRSLDFTVGFYGDIEAAKECLRIIDSYNAFDGEAVAQALDVIPDDARPTIRVGREGSPVLYVTIYGSEVLLRDVALAMQHTQLWLGRLAEGGSKMSRDWEHDPNLALWFTPGAIRSHFDGDDDDRAAYVQLADDRILREIGEECLAGDVLYNAFRECLCLAVDERLDR